MTVEKQLEFARRRAQVELYRRDMQAKEAAAKETPEDRAAFRAVLVAIEQAKANGTLARRKRKIRLKRAQRSQGIHRIDIRLPGRQILTLRNMAEIEETTLSEQVRPILDAILRLNDNAGGDIHHRFLVPLDLQRTTLYLTEMEVQALKAKAVKQNRTVSFVIRQLLDMYLYGEGE